MLRVVLLGFVLLLTDSLAFTLDGRIINGTKAEKQPWVAEIILNIENELTHYCAGSLIHPKWVLSAAHYFYRDMYGHKLTFPLSYYRVTIGSTKQLEGEYFNIIKAEPVHAPWVNFGLRNDLCLLELETAVPPSIGKPIQLPQKGDSYAGQLGSAFGWGLTENGKNSENLMEGRILITKNSDCTDLLAKTDSKKLCGDPAVTHSSPCGGDAGGPLAVKSVKKSKEFILVGISSYQDGTCNRIDVYTRVSEFLDWISEHTGLAVH